MATTRNYSVTLRKAGMDLGIWAEKSGGAVTREITDFYPGAMLPARKLTGVATTADLVVRKLEADLTDAQLRALYADVDTDTEYTGVVQRLTAADRPSGAARGYRGVISGITEPDTAGGAGTDPAMIEITLAVVGKPTVA
jgi:hypothetical protein